jgi:hypothetical protein
MGPGAAFLMPGTLAVLMQLFDEAERPRAIGIWAAVLFLVPESKDPTVRKPDLPGSVLSTVGMVSLVWTVISVPQHGWDSPQVPVSLALGLSGLLAFALWERHTPEPMLDPAFFADRRFTGAVAGGVLAAFGMGGSLFLLTQHLQGVLGCGPLEAGLRVAPMAITLLVVSNVTAPLGARLGAGNTMLLGMTTVATESRRGRCPRRCRPAIPDRSGRRSSPGCR